MVDLPADKTAWILATGFEDLDSLSAYVEPFPLTTDDLVRSHMRLGIEHRDQGFALMAVGASPGEGPPGRDEPTFYPVAIFCTQKSIVLAMRDSSPELEQLFDAWIADPKDIGRNPGELLVSILDVLIDSYFPVLDEIHDRMEEHEDRMFEGRPPSMPRILNLKKQLLLMRRQISPVRENINSLIRVGQPVIRADDLPALQDLYNHTLRIAETIDTGRDIVTGLLDVHLNIASTRLNEVMRTLTVISTILMTGALIAGIYGMNFKNMPELDWRYGYPFSIGLMVVVGAGIYALFVRLGYVGNRR